MDDTGLVEKVKGQFDKVQQRANQKFESLKREYEGIMTPESIEAYMPTIKQTEFILNDIRSLSVDFDYSIIEKIKNDYKVTRMSEWVQKGDALEGELNKRMEEIQNAAKERADENNKEVESEFEQGNKVYLELEEKRKKLEEYQDDIIDLCSVYGITSSDIAIDNNSFKLDEWNAIYDSCFDELKKHGVGVNPITRLKELIPDRLAQSALALIIFIMCLTSLLNIVAGLFYALVVYSELTAKRRMEKYGIMLGLLYNVRPLEMGYVENLDESKLIDEEEAIDDDPETDKLVAWYEEESAKYEAENPEEDIEKELQDLTSSLSEVTLECEKFKTDYTKMVQDLCSTVETRIEELKRLFEEAKNNVKLLGDVRSIHYTYEPKYMLGLKDGCIPEYVDTGLRNIVFRPCRDEHLMKRFIQCMVINAFQNVKLPSLSVTICDPTNFGRDIIGFINDNTDRLMHVSTDKMDDVLKTFIAQAQDNMRTLRGRDITEYNHECELTGKTAIEYNLIIILSQAIEKEGSDTETLDSFMRYSHEAGIFIWVVTNKSYQDTFVFNRPFEGVAHPYEFDDVEFLIQFGDKFGQEVKKSRPPGLPWQEYVNKTFKGPDDIWNVTTNEFVWFEPGFVDGDPSRPDHYTLGNSGDVHAVIAGTSGAGKSVFINQLLGNMTLRHSPEELRLWLVDFKGSEFSLYLKSDRFPYQLPHLDACLCTSDPDYAKSLFRAIRDESERRYNILKDNKKRNIVEWNNDMRKSGHPEKIFPRIVFLVDEFQVIYTKADNKTIESVNMDITILSKVARAAGVHVVFCSQSMKGTVSSDILNMFTLRFCLRCEPEVSMQILGTPFAGNIRQKFGILYVRSVDDPKPELQKRFKTPFQKDNSEVEAHIKHMALEAEKRGFKTGDVIEYDESTIHPINQLQEFYEQSLYPLMDKGNIPSSGTVVLGKRMSYSKNKAPENFILTAVNNANIFSCFQNNVDLVNFFMSLKKNFDMYKGKYQVIYNAQVDDLHYLCHLDEIVPANLQKMSTKKTSMKDMVTMYKQILEKRQQTKDTSFPIIFVCIGWTSAVGFGIESDFKNVVEPLSTMLQTAGEFNIHWIFIGNGKNSTPLSIIKGCEYKICGKVDESTSTTLLDTTQASKPQGDMKAGYAFFFRKGELSKFKIYQSELDREIKASEIVI